MSPCPNPTRLNQRHRISFFWARASPARRMRATTATHIHTRRQREAAGKNSPQRKSNENQRQTLRKTAATKSTDHYQLVARATKDAIRDWDLTSGALTWPQGLDSLLGYSPSGSGQTIAFWQQQIHRDDRSRIAASIREAIKSKAEHWIRSEEHTSELQSRGHLVCRLLLEKK